MFSAAVIAGDASGTCSRNASPDSPVTDIVCPAFSSARSSRIMRSAASVVRNSAVIGASVTGASTPLATSTSKASMHSSLSGTLARTARFHDDRRQLAANWTRKLASPESAVKGMCSGAAGSRSERSP